MNETNRDKMKENEEKRGEARTARRREKKPTKHKRYPHASVDRSELSGRVVRWPAGNAPSTSPSIVLRASPPECCDRRNLPPSVPSRRAVTALFHYCATLPMLFIGESRARKHVENRDFRTTTPEGELGELRRVALRRAAPRRECRGPACCLLAMLAWQRQRQRPKGGKGKSRCLTRFRRREDWLAVNGAGGGRPAWRAGAMTAFTCHRVHALRESKARYPLKHILLNIPSWHGGGMHFSNS